MISFYSKNLVLSWGKKKTCFWFQKQEIVILTLLKSPKSLLLLELSWVTCSISGCRCFSYQITEVHCYYTPAMVLWTFCFEEVPMGGSGAQIWEWGRWLTTWRQLWKDLEKTTISCGQVVNLVILSMQTTKQSRYTRVYGIYCLNSDQEMGFALKLKVSFNCGRCQGIITKWQIWDEVAQELR